MTWKRRLNLVLNTGLVSSLSFEESRKVKAVNFAALLGILSILPFWIWNLLGQRYVLWGFNSFVLLGNALIFWLQFKRFYYFSRYAILLGAVALFTVMPVVYHNDTGYYLILVAASIFIFFENIWVVCGLLLLTVGCFVFVEFGVQQIAPVGDLPVFRKVINIIDFFLLFTAILYYYKWQQRLYHRKLETINAFLNEKSRSLEELNKTKEKIFSILSHDLREPMASVKSLLTMLDREMLSPADYHRFSSNVNTSLDRVALVLDNTLNWSLAQFRGIRAMPEDFYLREITVPLKDLLEASFKKKQLLYADYIPREIRLHADKEHVNIILRNLLYNAIKFTPQKGFINISVIEKETSCEISVEDSGIGMDDSMLNKLFNKQEHFTRRGTDNERGLGVGLSLVKELVEMNRGHIVVKSIPGKGTTIIVTIPRAETPVVPSVTESALSQQENTH